MGGIMKQFSVSSKRALLGLAITLSLTALPARADTEAELAKANAQFEQADYRTATITLKNLLQRDPGVVDARLLLGRTQLRLGDGAGAEKELRRAAELGPTRHNGALRWPKPCSSRPSSTRSSSCCRSPSCRRRARPGPCAAGRAHLGLKQTDEARAEFAEAVALDPTDRLAGMGLAQLSLMAGDLEAAATATDTLIEQAPGEVDPAVAARRDIFARAERSTRPSPPSPRPWRREPEQPARPDRTGHHRVRQQAFEAAAEDLDQIDSINPDIFIARYLRGVIAFYERDWDKAAELLQQVLAAQPGHIQSQLLMGVISYAKNELQIADEYLSNVLRAMPNNMQARKVLAATHLKLREPNGPSRSCSPGRARRRPDHGAARQRLPARRRDRAGPTWLSRAVEAAPDVAALRTQFALTLIAGGKMDEAITELDSAVDSARMCCRRTSCWSWHCSRNRISSRPSATSRALEQRRPDSPIPYNLTGLAFLAQGDHAAARERFQQGA
jgi:putative PEP-CTERM system TPR-repeat lipoprotein